jgi:hypothetical protein
LGLRFAVGPGHPIWGVEKKSQSMVTRQWYRKDTLDLLTNDYPWLRRQLSWIKALNSMH